MADADVAMADEHRAINVDEMDERLPAPEWCVAGPLLTAWNIFADPARELVMESKDGGLFIKQQPAENPIDMRTFAACFDIREAAAEGERFLELVCRLRKCGKVTRLSWGSTIKFSNSKDHACRCCALRTHADWVREQEKDKDRVAGRKRALAEAEAAPAAGAGAASAATSTGCKLSADELTTAWARTMTLGKLPIQVVQNFGIKYLFSLLGVQLPHYDAVRRAIRTQRKQLRATISASIAAEKVVATVRINGKDITLERVYQMMADNWTHGTTYMGVGLSSFKIVNEWGKLVLRPQLSLISYQHFQGKADEDHNADLYRVHYGQALKGVGLTSDNIFSTVLDTTAVNFKSVKGGVSILSDAGDNPSGLGTVVDLRHALHAGCGEHEAHLVGVHTARVPIMHDVVDASNDLSQKLRGSGKLRTPLIREQEKDGVTRPLIPMTKCPTRFFYNLLQPMQLERLEPWLTKLRARWTAADVSWLADYLRLHDRYTGQAAARAQILELFAPMLKVYNRLGSEQEFTASTRALVFYRWTSQARIARSKPGCVIGEVIDAFETQLWERFASLAQLAKEAALLPAERLGPVIALGPVETQERLSMDELTNAAAFCDPAMLGGGFFSKLGGNRPNARQTLIDVMDRMASKSVAAAAAAPDAPAAGAAAGAGGAAPAPGKAWVQARTLRDAKTAIRARPRDHFEGDDEFAQETERLCTEEATRRQRLGIADAATAAAGPAEDLQQAMKDELLAQCVKYEALMTTARVADDAKSISPEKPFLTYGDPLADTGKATRYAFWPEHAKEFWLLAPVAMTVVTAQWTPMKLERVNSAAGIISNRLRASMKPEMLETLILGQQWLKDMVSQMAAPKDLLDLASWAENLVVSIPDDEPDSDDEDEA